jgi:ArsR family transcriptional regulator, arsenate/arsenite/antimonite-responsive transcriptional repressor
MESTFTLEPTALSEDEVVAALAALAQPVRLQIFRALVVAGPEGLTPGTMAQALQSPAATLSFHLKELLHAGLVHQQRDGRFLIYRAEYARMNTLLGYLTAHCCQGAGCLPAASTAAACC